jgi:dethiobiotin synthetase
MDNFRSVLGKEGMGSKGIFVTGTDTGVGKSVVAAALLYQMGQQGRKVGGFKPVASGAETTPEGLRNEDALLLQRYSTISLPYDLINPFCFAEPIAPHLAASHQGVTLNLECLKQHYSRLASHCDAVVVEGAGGWRVPLNDQQDFSNLAASLGLPVVLVVAIRLGCINHALLSVESILAKGVPLLGWVANCLDLQTLYLEEQIETLQTRIDAPCLGVVPAMNPVAVEEAAKWIDLSRI